MPERDVLALRFEQHRTRLRAVAYQMLGSLSEADDAVQETWLRLERVDADEIENLGGWLTTVAGRVCLNLLRSRRTRAEMPLASHVPDPVVSRVGTGGVALADPEQEALLAESVGLAMFVVLDALAPAERLAFVLHDVFAVPFADIAGILETTPAAARQLASRSRRRVREAPVPDVGLGQQREVVDAFFAAARDGDFDALVALLHPDVVLRSDGGTARASASRLIHGAATLAGQAMTFAQGAPLAQPAVVNAAAGVVIVARGLPLSVMAFVVKGRRIVEIEALADPARLALLDLSPWMGDAER